MPTVTIKGLGPLDGDYSLDMRFTHRDYRDIKRIAGVRANEVMEALEAGDLDLFVALASIALRRADVPHDVETLWDAEAPGGIDLNFDEDEAEVVDSPQPSADAQKNDGDGGASGETSNGVTGSSQETPTPPVFGIPQPEDTSAPVTSTP